MSSEPKAIVPAADAPLANLPGTPSTSIEVILSQAVQAGRTGAELKELLDVFERMQGLAAVQAFNAAMVEFKRQCPPIPRGHTTDQFKMVTPDGRKVPGRFAALDDIAKVVDPIITRCGLSYAWPKTTTTEGVLFLTCRISHTEGHSEDTTLCAEVASKGGMSAQQMVGSAASHLCRYTLSLALGLSTTDDNDGRGDQPAETITEEQARHIDGLLIELHDYDKDDHTRGRFLAAFGVEKMAELPSSKYDAAVDALSRKIAKAKEKAEGT